MRVRLFIVIAAVIAFAVVGAGWKWQKSGSPSTQQLAGWSWDGNMASSVSGQTA